MQGVELAVTHQPDRLPRKPHVAAPDAVALLGQQLGLATIDEARSAQRPGLAHTLVQGVDPVGGGASRIRGVDVVRVGIADGCVAAGGEQAVEGVVGERRRGAAPGLAGPIAARVMAEG